MSTPVINVQNICKNYYRGDQKIAVLKNINVLIQKGEFLAIKGKSGSGKSTLLNILGLLDTPSSGSYDFVGNDVLQKTQKEQTRIRGSRMGFVFQQYNLIPRMSVVKQVALPLFYRGVSKKERIARAIEALRIVELEDFCDRTPMELSGGQQQRVAIARCIVTNPDIIFADEPTGALDSKTGSAVMDIFHTLHKKGSTIIAVTHDDAIAQQSDRIIHIVDGKII